MTLRVVELFAGIGAQRMALILAGIPHEVVAICEINKHSLASYKAIYGDCPNLGDITKVEALPPCDLVTYSFPCLTGDTLVKTIDGWERIDGLDRPKRVWTKDGWKMATASVQTGFKEVIDIETMMGHRISATHEHRFWARRRTYPWDNEKRMNVRAFEEPEWVEAKDLTTAHYLGYKVPDEESMPYYGGLTQKYKDGRVYQRNALGPMMETEGFWWTVGRYVADGYIRTDGNAVLCIGYSKEADLDLIPLKFTESREPTVVKAIVTSVEFGAFCERFGEGAENKRIPPEFHALPRNLAKAMLEGYLSGDGHFDPEKGQWSITTVSKGLALDIAGLVAYVHHRPSSIYKAEPSPTRMIEGREVCQRVQYTVRFHTDGRKQDKAFYEDGWIWFPIRRLTVSGRVEPVYDISVEDSHSFTANGVTVHNCQDLSLAGKRRGMGEGTRSGLVWEVMRLLESERERPEWLLMENVPQVLTSPLWGDLIGRLEAMGYRNKWRKLDSSRFGSAQKRVRAFMVSRLGQEPPDLPECAPNAPSLCLRDVMEPTRDERYVKRIPLDRIRWREPKEGYRHPQSEGLKCRLMDASDPRMETRRIASEGSLCPALRTGCPQKAVEEEEEERVRPLVERADNLRMAPKGRKAVGSIKDGEERLVVAPSDKAGESTPTAEDTGESFYSRRMLYSSSSSSPTIRTFHSLKDTVKVVEGSIDVFGCDDGEGNVDQNIVPSKTFLNRRYYTSSSSPCVVSSSQGRIKVVGDMDRPTHLDYQNRLYSSSSSSPSLISHGGSDHEVKVVAEDVAKAYGASAKVLSSSSSSPTLRAQVHGLQNQPKVMDSESGGDLIVSILTPRECWRLMGFPEWAYLRASRMSSETQLYNQAGNSIVVEVLMAIFSAMFRPQRRIVQMTFGEASA